MTSAAQSAINRTMTTPPLILLAAGGTGGHLFPAEALGTELIKRGYRVRLATDDRALRYSGLFTADMTDLVPSETVRGRDPVSLARTAIMLGYGLAVALKLVRRLKPAAVIGFSGRTLVRSSGGCSTEVFGASGLLRPGTSMPRAARSSLVTGRPGRQLPVPIRRANIQVLSSALIASGPAISVMRAAMRSSTRFSAAS